MKTRFKQSALRKGRYSEKGSVYSVVKTVEDATRPLIADPANPDASVQNVSAVVHSIQWHHEKGYFICLGYTVMPDHYHLVFLLEEDRSLGQVMGGIGGFTAKEINRLNGWSGRFWQTGYYDRMVRDDEELENQLVYARENPVRAGFVEHPEDWPFTEVFPDWESPLVG